MKKEKPKTKEDIDDIASNGVDFSFEDADIEKAVDKMLKSSGGDKEKPEVPHISEKIRLGMEIKHNLPDKGYLRVKAERGTVKYKDKYGETFEEKKVIITSKDVYDVEYVEITDGLFAIDFRDDCNYWFIRSPNVVPALINQAVRTAIDVKKCYEMEKRRSEIPIWLIAALIGGAVIIIIMLWSLLG